MWDVLVQGSTDLCEEAPPHSLCVGLQGAEVIPTPQQREESIGQMAEVLHYHPVLDPAVLVVDRLQIRNLCPDDMLI